MTKLTRTDENTGYFGQTWIVTYSEYNKYKI